MTKTFTQNDLLRFLYGEMSNDETEAFKNALRCEPLKREEYSEYILILDQLETILIEPSKRVIDTIIDYAKKSGEVPKVKLN